MKRKFWTFARIDWNLLNDDPASATTILPTRLFPTRTAARRAADAEWDAERAREYGRDVAEDYPGQRVDAVEPWDRPLVWTRRKNGDEVGFIGDYEGEQFEVYSMTLEV